MMERIQVLLYQTRLAKKRNIRSSIVSLFFLLLITALMMASHVTAEDLEPSLLSQGYVMSEQIETDAGRYVFYGSEIMFDRSRSHANFEKTFAKRPFATTLYKRERRLKCYEFVLRENAQLASMSTTQSSELHLDILRSMATMGEQASTLDFMKMHYIPSAHDFLTLRNSLNTELLTIKSRTMHGIPVKTSNLSKIGDAAEALGWAVELGSLAQAAVVQQALSGDAALSRLEFIEETLRNAERNGENIDPLWFEAIENTRIDLSREDYIGCFMMVLKDNTDKLAWHSFDSTVTYLVGTFHTNLEAYAKSWFMHVVKHSNPITKGQIAASHASSAASLWTISLVATIKTIEALLDQHEKAQCAVAAATLDHLLHKGFEGTTRESTSAKAAVYQSQISYYSKMEASTKGFLTVFHDLIAKLFGQTTFAEAAEYFESMKTTLLSKLVNLLEPPPEFGKGDALLCFLIDSSGSMEQNDPYDIRKRGLEMVVETRLSGKEDIVIVDFDAQARWLTETTYDNWTPMDLSRAINRIDSDGGTDVHGGLKEVQRALENVGYEGRRVAVLLLSDGIDQNTSTSSASWFAEKGISIHSVSLVGRANEELLKQIALSTGGECLKARTPEEILYLFNQFYNRLAGGSSLAVKEITVSPGSVEELDLWIDVFPDIAISMEYFGSNPNLYVTSPTGERLDFKITEAENGPKLHKASSSSQTPNLSYALSTLQSGDSGKLVLTTSSGGTRYASMKIEKPQPGRWTVHVDNRADTHNSVQCKLYVFGQSDLAPELTPGNLNADGSLTGVLELNLEGVSDEVVSKYEARVKVMLPDGRESDISDSHQDGRIRYMPTEGPGNYRFIAEIEGQTTEGLTFNRYVRRDVLIGAFA